MAIVKPFDVVFVSMQRMPFVLVVVNVAVGGGSAWYR